MSLLDPVTGQRRSQSTISAKEADISDAASVQFAGANAAAPILAWTGKARKQLKINVVGSQQVHTFPIPNERLSGEKEEVIDRVTVHAPRSSKALPHFLVHYQTAHAHWADVYHIDLATSAVKRAYSLPRKAGRGAFAASSSGGGGGGGGGDEANVYFTRVTQDEFIVVSSVSHGVVAQWALAAAAAAAGKRGEKKNSTLIPVHAVAEAVVKPGGGKNAFAVRCAVASAAGDWLLIRNGEVAWQRPEALAGVVAAEWAELGADDELAEELQVEGHTDIWSAYMHRVRRHARDLSALPAWLKRRPRQLLTSLFGVDEASSSSAAAAAAKDSYGFHKLIILATERGRLYALDVGDSGRIVWTIDAAAVAAANQIKAGHTTWDVKRILVDKGRAVVREGDGGSITVDITAGRIVSRTPGSSSHPCIEHIALVDVGGSSAKVPIAIYEDGRPERVPTRRANLDGKTLVTRGKDGNSIRGLRFVLPPSTKAADADGNNDAAYDTVTAWEFAPAAGEHIAALAVRAPGEPVASIGRVLGDRSVLYKYLNPHTLLVAVAHAAAARATVHLLDAVSGRVLHSATHAGVDATRPISAASCTSVSAPPAVTHVSPILVFT